MRKSIYAIAAVLLLLAAGCDTMTEPETGSNRNGKAVVSLAITGTEGRTVHPAVPELDKVTAWRLQGVSMRGREILSQFRTDLFADPKGQTLYLDTGDWDFTLEGYTDETGDTRILAGTLNQQITLEGPNTLSFLVAPLAEGTGTVRITITLPEGHGITQARVFKDAEELAPITPGGTSVFFEQTGHPAGDYYYRFRLYRDQDLYGVVSELISVRQNLTSEKTYPLNQNDLNLRYAITYHLSEGGALKEDKPSYHAYQYTDADFTLPEPARDGYDFVEWHDKADLTGDPVTQIGQGSTGDQDFWAEWSPVHYPITYKPDDQGFNYGTINPKTYTVESDPIALVDPPVNEGFRFDGWFSDALLQNKITAPVTTKGDMGAKTFYAQWTPVYPIKYELEGGSGNGGNPATYTVEDLPLILKKPTPNGAYTFLYWYVSGYPNTPVFTIPEGSTETKTFYAKWHQNGQSLASTADIGAYLVYADGGDSAENPIDLPPVTINLADGGWAALLTAISGAGKYVALDLSDCTMSDAEFDPGTANNGEKFIVSLTLPEAATSVKAAVYYEFTFRYFTALTSVTGKNVKTIGDSAFRDHKSLTEVNLSNAESIGAHAFRGCASLKKIDLPNATTIGGYAFNDCIVLETIVLSKNTTIGTYAFAGCSALKTVDLPNATTINQSAFQGCAALTEISLPSATRFEEMVFWNTGTTALTITLGSTAPKTGSFMFADVSSNKTVTVIVPKGAEGYGTLPVTFSGGENTTEGPHWGEGFRGRGWGGTEYRSNAVNINTNITLTIKEADDTP